MFPVASGSTLSPCDEEVIVLALSGVGDMGRGKEMVRSPREKSKQIGGRDFILKSSRK